MVLGGHRAGGMKKGARQKFKVADSKRAFLNNLLAGHFLNFSE